MTGRSGERSRPYDLATLVADVGLADATPTAVCRHFRVSGESLATMRALGLTERQADTLAIRAGRHPGQVWESWWTQPWLDLDDASSSDPLEVAS